MSCLFTNTVVSVGPRAKKFNICKKRQWAHAKMRIFSFRHTFWANLVHKIKIVVKLKFGTQTNSHMQDSMVMFTFSVFDQKYPFWVILVQKNKIVSLSCNLVFRLIRVRRIQWRRSFFPIFDRKDSFLWQSCSRKS